MLSSNMAASIAMAIIIHLCKHLFTLLCVTVSQWTSPFVVQVHDDRLRGWCTWLSWISRSVCTIRWPCWRTAWRQWKHSIPKTYLSICLHLNEDGTWAPERHKANVQGRVYWEIIIQEEVLVDPQNNLGIRRKKQSWSKIEFKLSHQFMLASWRITNDE